MKIDVSEVFAACRNSDSPLIDKPEPTQIDYSRHIAKIIACGNGQAFVEADTGVGKTIGYLIPAALSVARGDTRAIISTYTKSLQRQVMTDAARVLPGVEAVTGRRLKVGRLVGRANFFDIDKVREMRKDVEKKEAFDDLIAWLEDEGSSGEIQDYIEEAGNLPNGIPPSLVCLDAASSAKASMRYDLHREAAYGADILVTNHALACLASLRGLKILHRDEDPRAIGVIIFDEADRLLDAARSILHDVASLRSINRLVGLVKPDLPEALGAGLQDDIDTLMTLARKIGDHYDHEVVLLEDIMRDYAALYKRLSIASVDLCEKIKAVGETMGNDERVLDLLRHRRLIDLAFEKDSSRVGAIQFSPKRSYPSIALTSIYPGRIVRSMIDRLDDCAVIFTSATLAGTSSGGDPFWEIRSQLGAFDRENPCAGLSRSFPAKDFGQIERIVIADPSVHKPFENVSEEIEGEEEDEAYRLNDEWAGYAARMILQAAGEDGYALALCNSYRSAARLQLEIDALGARVPIVGKLRAEQMDSAVSRLLKKSCGVLITPSGWEGLDARSYGFSWKAVVIAQIPLSRADSAYKAALTRYLVGKGRTQREAEEIVYGEIVSAAFRKLRQGIGRGIRKKDDRFSLYIADPRVPPYGNLLDTDELIPAPHPANRAILNLQKALPKRFRFLPVEMMLKDGKFVS